MLEAGRVKTVALVSLELDQGFSAGKGTPESQTLTSCKTLAPSRPPPSKVSLNIGQELQLHGQLSNTLSL